jgi:phage-related protein
MRVEFVPEAFNELQALPEKERRAIFSGINKLREIGDQLSYPHSSLVLRGTRLREVRPRAGRSPWRALYQRMNDRIMIAAICPEANHDPRGFARGIANATARLVQVKEGS